MPQILLMLIMQALGLHNHCDSGTEVLPLHR